MKMTAALVLLLLSASQVFATPNPNCVEKYEVVDNTQLQMVPGDTTCFISVSPRNVPNLTYRDFLFDDAGLFMIFNSFGPGPESETTGAREFYFFPRDVAPLGYTYDASTKSLKVTTPSGKVFTFNTDKSVLKSITNTTFTTDFTVDKSNKGGIEITKNDGFYLDLGFEMGKSPSQNPNDKITFKDTQSNSCQVKNSDVFNYTQYDDVIFKYDDKSLKQYLTQSCPQLKL